MTVDSVTVVLAAMAAAAGAAAAMRVRLVLLVTERGEMTLVALAAKVVRESAEAQEETWKAPST